MKILLTVLTLSFFALNTSACTLTSGAEKNASSGKESNSKIIHLNVDEFKQQVFDYSTNKEWKYEGKVPAILDFYANWCGPCRQLSPVLEKLQNAYGDKLQIYKIDTDKEKELAAAFGIRSLPTLVFVPLNEEPQAAMGYRGEDQLNEMIKEILKVEK